MSNSVKRRKTQRVASSMNISSGHTTTTLFQEKNLIVVLAISPLPFGRPSGCRRDASGLKPVRIAAATRPGDRVGRGVDNV